MEERDFTILAVLQETRNITKASDILCITQPALSKRIVAIEEELGTTILLRSRQGIRFTSEGEIIREWTKKAQEDLSHMREALAEKKPYLSGTLTAGISVNFAQYSLPDILMDFHLQHPQVKPHIIAGQSRDLYLQLLDGKLDIAIVRGDFPYQENKVLLSKEDICLITSMEDAGKDLNDIPFIGRNTDTGYIRLVKEWMKENDIHTGSNEMLVDSLATCVEMVSRGLGWTIVPSICLGSFKGNIRPLRFANGEMLERPTYLLYSGLSAKLPQVSAFARTIIAHTHKEPTEK